VCSGLCFLCYAVCLCLNFFVYVFDGHGGEQWVKIRPVDIVYVAPFRVIVILAPCFLKMQITERDTRHVII